MEHRWSSRKPMMGNVVMDGAGMGTISADIRNISLGGMFVEAPVVSPINSVVTLAFSLSSNNELDHYRLHAVVVRCADDGVALMFQDLEMDIIRSLRQTLYGPIGSSSNWPATCAA